MKNQNSVRLTRKDLYQEVWEIPMSTLATKYGISDRGLAKICDRLAIPTPGRGYWARKAAGKHVIQYQLPKPGENTPYDVIITEYGGLPQPSPKTQATLSKTIEESTEYAIPKRLASPHPVIKEWLDEYKRRKQEEKEEKKRDPFGVNFSSLYNIQTLTPIDRRQHRILHVLFNEVEKQGYVVKSDRYEDAWLEYDGVRIEFVLREKLKQIKRPLTDEEKASIFTRDQSFVRELEPSGKLHFSIKTHIEKGLRREWNETDRKSLEKQLPTIIATLTLSGPILVEKERKWEEAQRRYQEEERRRYLEEEALKKDQNQWRQFLEYSKSWQQVKHAREFINAIEEKVTDQHQQVGNRTVQEWLTWARDWTEEQDPMANEIEVLFNSLSKTAPYTYDN